MNRLFQGLGIVALAIAATACSGASGASPSAAPSQGGEAPAGEQIVVVAKDLAFSPTEVAVPADEAVEIVLDNQEAAPHNIAIKNAAGDTVFQGEIVSSKQVVNAVPALAAGSYTFLCEVHPTMTGTITAS